MASRLGEAYIAIVGKDELDPGLNAARAKVNGWLNNIAQGIGQGIGNALANGIGNLLRAGVAQIGESITATSDLNESISKVGVAFADSSQEILEWSRTSETALGLSRQQALESASSFGLLFREMGVGTEKAADMSEQMVQLAADLASINNISVDEALTKLRAGLVGEAEPLRTVGVLLNEASTAQEAVSLGLATSTKNVTDQAKVMARYSLILKQTTLQQGDFSRTLEGTANQQRIFTASLKDISASIGRIFEPVYNVLLRNINKLIQDNRAWGEQVLQNFASGLASGIRSLVPFFAQLRAIFSYWLQPHSPPKLLPNLDKWGADALKIYLQGWTSGDFGELKTLGDAIEGVLRSFGSAGKIDQGDLVARIFGSTQAVAKAVDEFRRLGSVSGDSLNAIRRAAGPAGDSIAGLVDSYFELQKATKNAAAAQENLNGITSRYSKLIDPLDKTIDEISRKQQDLQDAQRVDELQQELSNPLLDWSTRQQDALELQRLELERQKRALEGERDTAVDTAQDKVDAAKKQQDAAQETFDKQQAALDQQIKLNDLAGEQAGIEQQLADKRKQAAEEAARLAEQLHDAMLAYQLSLADTSGKIAILRGELAKTKDGSAEYYRLLDQIGGLEQQAAGESQRKADQLHDAQLGYNLAISNTAGQIAIWREELEKTAPGTAEYFDILTRIAGLQQSLQGGGAGGGGDLSLISPTDTQNTEQASQAFQDLATAVQEAFGALTGNNGNGASMSDTLRSSTPTPELSQNTRDFIDAIKQLSTSIGEIAGPLEVMQEALVALGLATGKTKDDAEKNATGITKVFGDAAGTVDGIVDKDWRKALGSLINIFGDVLLWVAGALPGTDGGDPKDPNSPISNIRARGAGFLLALAGGMEIAFGHVFTVSYFSWLQWMSDQLHGADGSKPKDSASPIAGVEGSGSGLVNSFWNGMKKVWSDLSSWWSEKMNWIASQIPALPSWLGGSATSSSFSDNAASSLNATASSLPAMASSSSVSTDNSIMFAAGSIVVQASSFAEGQAAADGLLSKLRARGIRVGI